MEQTPPGDAHFVRKLFHSHAHKQPANLSADAAHLVLFAYMGEVTDSYMSVNSNYR